MSQTLPAKPSLVYLRKQAKDLLAALQSGDADMASLFAQYFNSSEKISLVKAQLVIAREYGFDSWPALRGHVASLEKPSFEAFIDAALNAGRRKIARLWWEEYQGALRQDFACAAMAGDLEAVRSHIDSIGQVVPPKGRPILCYPCFSHLVKERSFEAGIMEVVRFLLAQGADPNDCHEAEWGNEKWRETPLYGAAGVLNHAGLVKLLLDSGADPDDRAVSADGRYHGESLYHACDHPGHNECLRLILEANPSQPAKDYCILRKLDFEDLEGVRLFISFGADLNSGRPRTALSHAVLRGRSLEMLRLLLDAGADPNAPDEDGTTAYVLARRLANREASALLESYGAKASFGPHDALLIAAAEGDAEQVQRLLEEHPEVLAEFTELGRQKDDGVPLGWAGHILHDMARLGSTTALRVLLDLGMDPGMTNAQNETPLHWACLAGRFEAAELLCSRGAPLDVRENTHHCIPIEWAYWGSLYWNEPHGDYGRTVEVVLDAGTPLPSKLEGSPDVLAVLKARGAG